MGDSPANWLIAWRLHVAGCVISVVLDQAVKEKDTTDLMISWKSSRFQPSSYRPSHLFFGVDDFLQRCITQEPFNLLLVAAKSVDEHRSICQAISSYLARDVLVLVDSSFCIFLEKIVLELLPHESVILSLLCYANIQENNSFEYTLQGNEVSIFIGCSDPHCKDTKIIETLQEKSAQGKILQSFLQALQNGEIFPVSCIQVGIEPRMDYLLWNRLLSLVAIETLCWSMDEPDPTKLLQDAAFAPIVKGLFYDLLNLANSAGCKALPTSSETARIDTLIRDLSAKYTARYPPNMHTAKLYHSQSAPLFFQHYHLKKTWVNLYLVQILQMAEDFSLHLPYVNCLFGYSKVMKNVTLQLRKAEQTSHQNFILPSLQQQIQVAPISNRKGCYTPSHLNHLAGTPTFQSTKTAQNKKFIPRSGSNQSSQSGRQLQSAYDRLAHRANIHYVFDNTTSRYGEVSSDASIKSNSNKGSNNNSSINSFVDQTTQVVEEPNPTFPTITWEAGTTEGGFDVPPNLF